METTIARETNREVYFDSSARRIVRAEDPADLGQIKIKYEAWFYRADTLDCEHSGRLVWLRGSLAKSDALIDSAIFLQAVNGLPLNGAGH